MLISKEPLRVYTDGSAETKHRTGGWAFLITNKATKITGHGSAINCTVNQMEQLAALMALQALDCYEGYTCPDCRCEHEKDYVPCQGSVRPAIRIIGTRLCKVITDSKYLQQGMEEHIYQWNLNGFKNQHGEAIANSYLWVQLYKMHKIHAPDWTWVKGHSGNKGNELVDKLASIGRHHAGDYLKSRAKTGKKFKDAMPIFDMDAVGKYGHLELAGTKLKQFIIAGKLQTKTTFKKDALI